MKATLLILVMSRLLGSGIARNDDIQRISARGYIAQWSDNSETLAQIYVDASVQTGIPLEVLVRQGAVESRFKIMAVGDHGASVGLHQIKWAYHDHDKLLRKCAGLGTWMEENEYCPRELLFDPTWNIRVAALKLRQLWDKYGSIELALVAYGCGQNTEIFRACKKRPELSYKLRHVRQVMGRQKIN